MTKWQRGVYFKKVYKNVMNTFLHTKDITNITDLEKFCKL